MLSTISCQYRLFQPPIFRGTIRQMGTQHVAMRPTWNAVSHRSCCSRCFLAPLLTRLLAKAKNSRDSHPASSSGHHLRHSTC